MTTNGKNGTNGRILAIPTTYKGITFRSRLEARWAVFFDVLGIHWEYEYHSCTDGGVCYLPDFWLPSVHGGVFWEIKQIYEYSKALESFYEDLAYRVSMLAQETQAPVVLSAGSPSEIIVTMQAERPLGRLLGPVVIFPYSGNYRLQSPVLPCYCSNHKGWYMRRCDAGDPLLSERYRQLYRAKILVEEVQHQIDRFERSLIDPCGMDGESDDGMGPHIGVEDDVFPPADDFDEYLFQPWMHNDYMSAVELSRTHQFWNPR